MIKGETRNQNVISTVKSEFVGRDTHWKLKKCFKAVNKVGGGPHSKRYERIVEMALIT